MLDSPSSPARVGHNSGGEKLWHSNRERHKSWPRKVGGPPPDKRLIQFPMKRDYPECAKFMFVQINWKIERRNAKG